MSSVTDEVPRPSEKLGFGFSASSTNRLLIGGLSAAGAWFVVAALTAFWPDMLETDWSYTGGFAIACAALAVALALAAFAGLRFSAFRGLQGLSPWLFALALFLTAWEVVTAKLGLLPLPFFPPPQAIVEVVIDDWWRLAEGIFASARLLATGYLLGAAVGFVTGVASVGRGSPVIGSTRSCGSSGRCPRRPGCRSHFSFFRRASAPAFS